MIAFIYTYMYKYIHTHVFLPVPGTYIPLLRPHNPLIPGHPTSMLSLLTNAIGSVEVSGISVEDILVVAEGSILMSLVL